MMKRWPRHSISWAHGDPSASDKADMQETENRFPEGVTEGTNSTETVPTSTSLEELFLRVSKTLYRGIRLLQTARPLLP